MSDPWFGEVDSERGADLSDDGVYRYRLWRRWADGDLMKFVMLNPSTADADNDDPTIRRCMGFARREGLAGIAVVNLYAYRTKDPKVLLAARNRGVDVVGRFNFDAYDWVARTRGPVVAAWGVNVPTGSTVRLELGCALGLHGSQMWCLGTTKKGDPRHPLYLRADAPLVRVSS